MATLDWYGCSTFRFRVGDLTIFLDAYIDRARGAPGTGLTADDVDECDWIVVGHSHFDHLYGAERIVANTGSTLIANYESVRVMEAAGVPVEKMIPVSGGERIELGEGVTVSVHPSLHSCVWSHGQMAQSGEVCLGDLGVTWHGRQRRFQEVFEHLAATLDAPTVEHFFTSSPGHSDRGDGGALLFLFETPEGSVLFQDTSGHWSPILETLRPDVALLAAAGRANVDGEPIQGALADFVAGQAAMLGAGRVFLTHHDDWLPGFSVPLDIEPIRTALAGHAPSAELVEFGYLEATPVFG